MGKRIPKYRKDETCTNYQERIAQLLVGADIDTIKEALHEVGVQAYLRGIENSI